MGGLYGARSEGAGRRFRVFIMRCLTLIAIGITLLATASRSSAQLVGYEGFDYTPGTSLSALNGGTGWERGWATGAQSMTIGTNSLTPPSPANTLATSGQHLSLPATTNFTTADRRLTQDLRTIGGGSVWVSFVITRLPDAPAGSYGGLVIGNEAGTANNSGRLFIGDAGSGSDTWALERATGGAIGVSNHTIATVPTALLVANIQFGTTTDTIALYVNRPPGGGTPQSVDAFLSNFDINPSGGVVNDFAVWYGGDGGYRIDEIRIGASYADVTPVPEPTGMLALGAVAAGLGCAYRRLRRSSDPT